MALPAEQAQRQRRSIRLPAYDYTWPGAYFVTIVTWNRVCFLGDVRNDQVELSPFGHVVMACWNDLPAHYPHVALDVFVVMPNHIHGVIHLTDPGTAIVGAGLKPAPTSANQRHGLPEIVRALKTFSARRINAMRDTPGAPVWQRNYYEHVVRDEDELLHIQEYIVYNPMKWEDDPENTEARSSHAMKENAP